MNNGVALAAGPKWDVSLRFQVPTRKWDEALARGIGAVRTLFGQVGLTGVPINRISIEDEDAAR